MIIKELWNKCIVGVKSKPMELFSIAKGETIAIDISCWLHAFTCRSKMLYARPMIYSMLLMMLLQH